MELGFSYGFPYHSSWVGKKTLLNSDKEHSTTLIIHGMLDSILMLFALLLTNTIYCRSSQNTNEATPETSVNLL
jgi:hypothetical protein